MKEIKKEYGRKAYVSDRSYPQFMKENPARAIWNTVTENNPNLSEFNSRLERLTSFERSVLELIKQSEHKKPYYGGNYDEMEYRSEFPPGINPPDGPDLPKFDNPDVPTYYPPDPPEGSGQYIFSFSVLGCYCPGSVSTVEASGSHIITGISVEDGSISNVIKKDDYTWEFSLSTTKTSGTVNVVGTMSTLDGVIGTGEDSLIGCGAWQCCNMEWNSPDTITAGATIDIGVTGGTGPYAWYVSGTNFSLGDSVTALGSNTLTAEAGSCGSATVSVVDSAGCEAGGTVRNISVGSWAYRGTECVVSGVGEQFSGGGTLSWEKIDGKWRNVSSMKVNITAPSSGYRASQWNCSTLLGLMHTTYGSCTTDRCSTELVCNPVEGCSQCVQAIWDAAHFPTGRTTFYSEYEVFSCDYYSLNRFLSIVYTCYCNFATGLYEWTC